ncbi:MAG: bifunctional nuclease family protein [Chloroflexota bacterium]
MRAIFLEFNTDRYLPIFIGQYEADNISIELQENRSHDRPLTHDLLKNIIENLDGEIKHIFVNDMRRDIYFARIVVDVNGEEREIDSRPSDAIALAVRAKCPIFVSEAVMDKGGVEPDEEIEIEMEDEPKRLPFNRTTPARDVPEELLEDPAEDTAPVDEDQFSAFADFVNSSLDLDELDDEDK